LIFVNEPVVPFIVDTVVVPVMVGEFESTTSPVPVELAVIAKVPKVVIGPPVTAMNDGTVMFTEVTDPPT
jgi:hypothetical protein